MYVCLSHGWVTDSVTDAHSLVGPTDTSLASTDGYTLLLICLKAMALTTLR